MTASLRKHYPKLHNEADHGRRKREGVVRKAQAKDFDLWEGYPSNQVDQAMAVSFFGAVVGQKGNAIHDSSGKAQVGFLIKKSPTDEYFGDYLKANGYKKSVQKLLGNTSIVEYIAVAPWNLEKEGARGWGSYGMYQAVKEALESKADNLVLLSANFDSNDFYDRIGMKAIGEQDDEAGKPYAFDLFGMKEFVRQYDAKHK